MDWKGIQEKIAVSVITAVILGGLALGWNFASEGGVIRLIGGIPEKDLKPHLMRLAEGIEAAATKAELEARIELPTADQSIPRGAVIAFDRDDLDQSKCPPGWQPFKNARARVIIGAGDPGEAPGKMSFDEQARPLTHYVRGQHGGAEGHELTTAEMPSHQHMNSRRFALLFAAGNRAIDLSSLPVRKIDKASAKYTDMVQTTSNSFYDTKATGEGKQHSSMPPYVALYFCKKD